ncbi:MAG: HAMP domain-containing histidine kinase [Bacteroidales bacterium]|nr:HAMP domain-containing histidine kinase [Bacteroidales bacterium]
MKLRYEYFITALFALAAMSLVLIQVVQTRRSNSMSDNMFNVGVGNAMDAVVSMMEEDVRVGGNVRGSGSFLYQELDSIVYESLLNNGIDLNPEVGIFDASQGSFLYTSSPRHEQDLYVSPYRYSFSPADVVSSNHFFVVLYFPSSALFMQRNSYIYNLISILLILLIVMLFIAALRNIRNQRRLDRMKNEFINNMTHEIKTPISTIALSCEMLQDASVTNDAAQKDSFVNIISVENQRMRILVENILQSARMSDRGFVLHPHPSDANQLVRNVARSFEPVLKSKGGSIDLNLDASQPVAEMDELHVTNMIYNLVDNGVKYSNQAPHIVVSTASDSRQLHIAVSDNGIGISREDQKHIFEKFYRVSTGDVHNVKGFGIGLNYVYRVVQLHHGSLKLESAPGQGSTFKISLPLRQKK